MDLCLFNWCFFLFFTKYSVSKSQLRVHRALRQSKKKYRSDMNILYYIHRFISFDACKNPALQLFVYFEAFKNNFLNCIICVKIVTPVMKMKFYILRKRIGNGIDLVEFHSCPFHHHQIMVFTSISRQGSQYFKIFKSLLLIWFKTTMYFKSNEKNYLI